MLGARTGPTWRYAILHIGAIALFAIACGGRATMGKSASGHAARPAIASATGRARPVAAATPQLPNDLSLLTLVTKSRGLARSYVPPDLVPISQEFTSAREPQQLRRPAAEALTQMLSDARREGLSIKVNSAYRSYDYQAAVLRSEISAYGCAQALQQVAAPGHSEHQLGLAADLTAADVGWDLTDKFAQTPEGRWLAAHAATYGFVLSYAQDKEAITGYTSEPWHYRYVTPPMAQAIVISGKSPTEYLLALGSAADTGVEKTQAVALSGFGCG